MDYVKRRLEEIRRQGLEEKIEKALNQHKRSQENPQIERNTGFKFETFLSYLPMSRNASLVLMGIAAGAALTTVVLSMKPGESEITRASQGIDLLNKRVELLGENITNLEDKLTHMLTVADAIRGYDKEPVTTDQQHVLESAHGRPAIDTSQSGSRPVPPAKPARKAKFTPTHTTATKLNLRPSASVKAAPIAILPAGTKVRKIGKKGDWYHVDTEKYGKGWCFSQYLNPLS